MELKQIYNAVVCSTWVMKSVAKTIPDKIEITKEELKKIIEATKDDLESLEETESSWRDVPEEKYESLEIEALNKDLEASTLKEVNTNQDVEMKDQSEPEKWATKENENEMDDNDNFEKKFNLKDYDKEIEDDGLMLSLGKLAVYADNKSDPLITVNDDSDSDVEDANILPTDNLIAIGRVEEDAASLEVYVYNSEEGSFYAHHDIILPSIPICFEWLNFDMEDGNFKTGNLLAIGSMQPVIKVWDLDIVNSLEPAYSLGRKARKKKGIHAIGHTDAVLSLAWNKNLEHILASGSADESIILWDLEKVVEAQRFSPFTGNVQALKWHATENTYLLSGSADKCIRLFDCTTINETCKKWELDGEVESVMWDPIPDRSFNFYATTDVGTVYAYDCRQEKPLLKIPAHDKACIGIVPNPSCSGLVVTASEDQTLKIWDMINLSEPLMVAEQKSKVGIVHTLSSSIDSPFAISVGGNKKANNFRVWDVRRSKKVRSHFNDRLHLSSEDKDENNADDDDSDKETKANKNIKFTNKIASNWNPPKKSKKKKGGHLSKRKRT